MHASIVIGLALAVGAPGAKDPPKTEPATIVGEWVGEKALAGGADLPTVAGGVVFEFTKDGKAVIREGASPRRGPPTRRTRRRTRPRST